MWKIMVADHKNQAPHRNEVSQNALLENCICFIFRQMTFLRQKLAENRKCVGWGSPCSRRWRNLKISFLIRVYSFSTSAYAFNSSTCARIAGKMISIILMYAGTSAPCGKRPASKRTCAGCMIPPRPHEIIGTPVSAWNLSIISLPERIKMLWACRLWKNRQKEK